MNTCGTLQPIIQIHPTRRCNLRCLHCYSRSGPEERDVLAADTLTECLDDAWQQGYRTASFSGGEPTLYPQLRALLEHAKHLGMRTTVTSNGMLLSGSRLEMLTGVTDVLAISLDGVPESHNHTRANAQAFERMAENLAGVRDSGIAFGFIFTLTQFNVHEIEWAAQFAADQGAKLFQIHPLEEVGRASELLAGSRPDEIESAYAFLESQRIARKYEGRLVVQLDIFHRDLMMQHPERFYKQDVGASPLLSACVSPLVVEAAGMVVPLGYGFARQFALGSLQDAPLRDLAPRWIETGYRGFRDLCRRVYDEACQPTDLPFLNWYEMVELRSTNGVPLAVHPHRLEAAPGAA
jgi:MoaA/NifB/PqqE/SkfB family radical SAM enzyme